MPRRRRRTCSPRTPRRALLWSPRPRATRAAERTASTRSSSKAWGWARRRPRAPRTSWNRAACARHVHAMCNVHAMCVCVHACACVCTYMCMRMRMCMRAPGAPRSTWGWVAPRTAGRRRGVRGCSTRSTAPRASCAATSTPSASPQMHCARMCTAPHVPTAHGPRPTTHGPLHTAHYTRRVHAQVRHLPQPPRRG